MIIGSFNNKFWLDSNEKVLRQTNGQVRIDHLSSSLSNLQHIPKMAELYFDDAATMLDPRNATDFADYALETCAVAGAGAILLLSTVKDLADAVAHVTAFGIEYFTGDTSL